MYILQIILFRILLVKLSPIPKLRCLDEVVKGTVERGAERLDVLVELGRLSSPLGHALGGEVEFLKCVSIETR